MHTLTPPPVPTGTIKSFGPNGPKYEVGEALRPLANGDWAVAIVLVESGEHAEYRLTGINDDPVAN
jgi:hypothetical protein